MRPTAAFRGLCCGLLLLACKGTAPAPTKPTTSEAKGSSEHGQGEPGGAPKDHHGETVALPPEATRAAGIEIVSVTRKAFSKHLRATARISLPPERTAKVSPRVPGRVAALTARLGQKVKPSTVLAIIESAQLGRDRADYLAAATKARVAAANFRRESDLLKKGITSEREAREAESELAAATAEVDAADARLHAFGLSDSEIRALKTSQHYSSRFPVRSPIEGTVIEAQATIGQSVESTSDLFTVGNLDELWVVIDVFESQLAHISLGQHVHVSVSAFPDKVFDG
ncbi:MAG TPA: efflux RND transporter periplasmic adaptor subunit, partial [Polyangia bacterium]